MYCSELKQVHCFSSHLCVPYEAMYKYSHFRHFERPLCMNYVTFPQLNLLKISKTNVRIKILKLHKNLKKKKEIEIV